MDRNSESERWNNLPRSVLLGGVLWLIGATFADAAEGQVGNLELAQIMQAKAAFKPVDAFDAPPQAPELIGREFKLEWPLQNGSEKHVGLTPTGFWTYNTETQELKVSVWAWYPEGRFYWQSSTTAGKTYEASNSYGAKTIVTPYRSVAFAIYDSAAKQQREMRLNIPAPEAREIVKYLRVRAEGVFAGDDGRSRVTCEDHMIPPRIDQPISVNERICFATVSLRNLSLVRTDTGEVLRRW